MARYSRATCGSIDSLLGHTDGPDPLEQVLETFGHFVPRRVQLGGQLYFELVKETKSDVDERLSQEEVHLAVALKVGSASGGLVGDRKIGEGAKKAAADIAETVQFLALGGDTTLMSSPQQWAATVKDPDLWRTIGAYELQPSINLLPSDLRDSVVARWNEVAPGGYPKPGLADLSFDVRSTPPGQATLVLAATFVPSGELTTMASDERLEDDCFWTFRYSGVRDIDFDQAPLFFLQYNAGKYILAADHISSYAPRLFADKWTAWGIPGFDYVASLVVSNEAVSREPLVAGRACLWRVTLSPEASNAYLFQHFFTKCYLGKRPGILQTISDGKRGALGAGMMMEKPMNLDSTEAEHETFLARCCWYLTRNHKGDVVDESIGN